MRCLRFFTILSDRDSIVNFRAAITFMFFMFLFSDPVQAEMVKGTIVSLQQKENMVTMHLKRDDIYAQSLTVQAAVPLPLCAQKGNVVRIWGTFSANQKLFIASDVRGPGPRYTTDTTGARSRLHHFISTRKSVGRNHHQTTKRRHMSRRRRRR